MNTQFILFDVRALLTRLSGVIYDSVPPKHQDKFLSILSDVEYKTNLCLSNGDEWREKYSELEVRIVKSLEENARLEETIKKLEQELTKYREILTIKENIMEGE